MSLQRLVFLLAAAMFCCVMGAATADTHVSGNITSDTTWGVGGGTYYVDSNVYVIDGATLTIEPGVSVRLQNSVSIYIGVNGTADPTTRGALVANGTSGNPISFTRTGSLRWGGIIFDGRGYSPAMASSMTYCNLSEAGRGERAAAVEFYAHSNVTVADCTINGSSVRGIYCDPTSRPSIQNNTVSGSGQSVYIAAENADALSGNTYTGNNTNAVSTYGDITRSLTWPNEGVPIWPDGNVTVYNSATLTLSPGLTIGMDNSTVIAVGRNLAGDATDQGSLIANGTLALPITITRRSSLRWGGVIFDGRGYSPTKASSLYYCNLAEAGRGARTAAVEFYGHSNVTVADCTISGSDVRGIYCDPASRPSIQNNTVSGSGQSVYIAAENADALSGNTYTGNNTNAVCTYGDVTRSLTWPNEGVAYWPDTSFTVFNSATLTLSPGITVGMDDSTVFAVGRNSAANETDRGSLIANGTLALPITFTRRSNYRWGGLVFEGRGYATLPSSLDHCIVTDVGRNTSVAVYFHNQSNVAITNSEICYSDYWGVVCDATSAPTLAGNWIHHCNGYPMQFKIDNPPVISGNTYSGNNSPWLYPYGNVTTDVTLPNDGIPYNRAGELGDIHIYDGAELTLLPGTEIRFDNSQGIRVGWNPLARAAAKGALVANGTSDNPISLVRHGAYRWLGIYFYGQAGEPLPSSLRYCTITDVGRNESSVGAYFMNHSNVTVENCNIANSEYWGIYCDATSAPTITANTISGCNGYPLGFAADNPPVLSGNTYTGNLNQAIYLYGDVAKTAILPNDGIKYDRAGEGDIDIHSGATWTVLPGTTIVFDNSQGIRVGWNPVAGASEQGALIADGTVGSPITFNRRGTYHWLGVYMDGRAGSPMASSLKHCKIVDAGRGGDSLALYFRNHGNVLVENCVVDSPENWGVYCDATSAPTIKNSTISSCNGYPLAFAADNPPVIQGNTYTPNNTPWVYLFGDVLKDTVLPYDGITYDRAGLGNITIRNGATWTILPNTTILFDNSQGIVVGTQTEKGALIAEGTPSARITLSRRGSYSWLGLQFDGRAGDPLTSTVKYCTLNNAGRSSSAVVQFVNHSNVMFYGNQVLGSETYGIYCDPSSHPTITYNKVASCNWHPVRIAAENADALSRNTYVGNGTQGISVYGDVTKNVTWPHEYAPPQTTYTYYFPDGPFTIYNGATLTLSPGNVVALENSWTISVGRNITHDATDRGAIVALGTPDLPIWFWSRSGYNWGSVILDGRGYEPLPSTFRHTVFRYGGRGRTAAVEIYGNSSVAMELCTVTGSENFGVYLDASSPLIDSSIVSHNRVYDIRGENGSSPAIVYTNAWGNGANSFSQVVPGGGCISQDPNLASHYLLQSPSPCIDTANPAQSVGDGARADMGAYQWGVALTSTDGIFNAGWNWFSIPLQPQNSQANASTLLGFSANNILFRWNPDTKNTELYPDDFKMLEIKRGYLLRLAAPVDVTYQAVGYVTHQTIPIPYRGSSMIGLPSLNDFDLQEFQIRNLVTNEVRGALEDKASPSPWMNWNWVYWDSVYRTAKLCSFSGGDDDTVHPWYGYRVWTNVDDLELILPPLRARGIIDSPRITTPTPTRPVRPVAPTPTKPTRPVRPVTPSPTKPSLD